MNVRQSNNARYKTQINWDKIQRDDYSKES